GKSLKMVYSGDTAHGKTVKTVDVEPEKCVQLSLTDEDAQALARQALIIEDHYGHPVDIEWGKDGIDGQLYILQARPETVQSRRGSTITRYKLNGKGNALIEGRAIGQKIGAGPVRNVADYREMNRVREGDVLVTDMT